MSAKNVPYSSTVTYEYRTLAGLHSEYRTLAGLHSWTITTVQNRV